MKKSVLLFLMMVSGLLFSQKIFFKYDDAGNQRYRGPDEGAKTSGKKPVIPAESNAIFDEKGFWNEVRIYPVPVREVLTIDWSDKAHEMISEISMYQHGNLSWVFQHLNSSATDKNIRVDMRGKYVGIYVITFILKDGRKMTKNIIKN